MAFRNCVVKTEPKEDDDEAENGVDSERDDSNLKLFCSPDIDCLNTENSTDVSDSATIDMRSRLLGFGLAQISKRRHNVLSLETKIELIKKLEQGESVSSLAKYYDVGRATIFDIKNKKDSIMSFASKLNNEAELKTRKTVRQQVKRSSKTSENTDREPCTSDSKMVVDLFTPKRKHNVLSIETKIEIIQRLEKGESGATLAPLYNVGRATISDIKSKKDSILMFASKLKSDDGLKKRKTMRKANDTSLENAVYMWYIQKLSQGEIVTGPLLCEKALELNSKLGGPSDFKASTGWLKNFRSRHGIKQIQSEKESFSVDVSEAKKFLESYFDLLQQEGYSRDDIYSADESEVDWQSMPERSLLFQRDEPLERVTILVCANASWKHALPLLMIGRSKKTKCFGPVSCLPVIYRWQKNAWMDSEIFMEWYANEFIPCVKREREESGKYGKVLLLLDNAPFHPIADMLNVIDENFKVMFLPPNVTTLAHPMDQAILKKLKWRFKRQILRRLLLATDDEESMVKYARRLTLKDCCYMLADAWKILSEENKKEAWKRAWGGLEESDTPDHSEEKDLKEFAELFRAIPGFSKCTLENAREWLKIDAGDPGDLILNEDEIVTSVQTREPDQDDEVSQDGETYPTHSEAFNAFETAMEWCEKQTECHPEQLILLKRLRDLAAKKIWITCDDSKQNK